jgi:hypothetical protein
MDSSCEYIEYAVAGSRQGVVLKLRVTTHHRKNSNLLRNISQGLGPGRFLWKNVYRVSMGKPEGKRAPERPRCTWEDGIKMDLREIGWGCV